MKKFYGNKRNNRIKHIFLPLFVMAGAIAAVLISYYQKNDYSKVINSTVCLYSEAGQRPQMSVEDYIAGAVISIVPADYEEETIKAVSVIVRTYVIQQMNQKDVDRLDMDELEISSISMDSLKQSLGDKVYNETVEKYESAVKQTKGKIITYNGEVIVPLYHMISSGRTRNANELFGKEIGYLKGKECNIDVTGKEYLKVVEIEKSEFENKIGKRATISKRDSAGYVLSVTTEDKEISGEDFAGILDLNSSCFSFTVNDKNNVVKIVTKGKGHGMGLSIYGANEMAKQGKKYDEILKYFYDGTKIE